MKSIKKIGVKLAATAMMFAMSFNVVACDTIQSFFNKDADETSAAQSFSAPAAQSRTFTGLANASDAKPGDIVVFGSYEQDNDESNGTEDIEWIVLDNTDGKLLVISKDILNYMRYSAETTVWEYSDLRSWLNGEFYDIAFDDSEKSSIVLSVCENPGNPYFGTSAGTGTNDNIFCLSYDEAYTYFSFTNWNESSLSGNSQTIIASPSVWAKKKKLASAYAITEGYYNAVLSTYGFSATCIGVEGCDWWLRTSGQDGDHACIVGMYGSVNSSETVSITVAKGVRPAMYLEY
jgi:hypothetical protein